MTTTHRQAVLALAATQHGMFTTGQAQDLGMTEDQLRTWARSGVAVRDGRGVWRLSGAPESTEQQAMAVVLRQGHGALLARSSAAWVWDVPGHRLEPVDVLHRRDEHIPESARRHTSRCLDDADSTVRRGLPVTTPTRTLFDLAGQQHTLRTRRDLNNLMARGLVTLPLLESTLDRLARRGRSGIVVMRRLIEEAASKGAPAGSNLELLVEEILETAGFRRLERQLPIYDDAGFVARVDFGDERRRLAIEVDSDRFHSGLVDRMLDEGKSARLERAGWTVVRITEPEIWHARSDLVTRLVIILGATHHLVAESQPEGPHAA